MPQLGYIRDAFMILVCLLVMNGCALLGLVTGDDEEEVAPDGPSPDVRLLVSDGERLQWLGRGGLESATEPFVTQLSVHGMAASADRSRIVVDGVDEATGQHDVWILQHAMNVRLVEDVEAVRVGPEARWIWVEHADEVALHHHEGGGEPAASALVGELELLSLGASVPFVVLKAGPMLEVVHPDGDISRFDPGMGAGWSLAAVRPDGLLVRPSPEESGTWFNLIGEAGGDEAEIPRLGFELRDGELTYRTTERVINVAEGMPDDLDAVVASDFGVVLAWRAGTLTYFDYQGTVLGELTAPSIPRADGTLPSISRIAEVVPNGVRMGVVRVEHTRGEDADASVWSSIHAYSLDETSLVLEVRTISERAASSGPGHFGHHEHSAFVAWIEGEREVVYYDVTTDAVARIEADGVFFFETTESAEPRHY